MIEIWWKEVIIKTRNTHDWATRLIKKSEKKNIKNGKSTNNEIKKNLGLILRDPESLLT